MASRMYKKCTVCNTRRVPGSNVFLDALPLDPARCRLWVQAIGQEDLVYFPIEKLHTLKYVCGVYFTREHFNKQENLCVTCRYHLFQKNFLWIFVTCWLGKRLTSKWVLRDSTNLIKNIQQIKTCHEEPQTAAECHSSSSDLVIVEENSERNSMDLKYGKRKFGDIDVVVSSGDPQPSTSSAPEKTLVQSYKRKRKSGETHKKNENPQDKREKDLLARLKKAKLSLRALARNSIKIDQLE